jgi:hypothetical protein
MLQGLKFMGRNQASYLIDDILIENIPDVLKAEEISQISQVFP